MPSRFHSCPLECGHACNLSCKISWCPRQLLGPGDTTLHQYTCPSSFLFLSSIQFTTGHLLLCCTTGHLSLCCLISIKSYRLKLCFYLHFFESLHLLALEALHAALKLVSPLDSDPEDTDAPP